MRHRHLSVARLLIVGLFSCSCLAHADGFKFQSKVVIPMRDGVKLAANIFMPEGPGPFPVILLRTPYGKGDEKLADGVFFAPRGYVVVVQDVRGRFDSEGKFEPFASEARDGFDTQEWIGAQAWCNGRIGTSGGSYLGFTQWITGPEKSRFLKAMAPTVPPSDTYSMVYVGGAMRLGLTTVWNALTALPPETIKKIDWLNKGFRYLPLSRWDEVVGQELPAMREWVAHPMYDDYWKNRSAREHLDETQAPTLCVGGWYDLFASAMLNDFSRLHHTAQDPAMRRNHLVIMGPWIHGLTPQSTKVGEVDFGEGAKFDLQQHFLSWFDFWLKQSDSSGVEDWPALKIFVMGENRWRDEDHWPLKNTQFTKFFLHAKTKANTLNGDGALSRSTPADEPADQYVYDPEDPTPTRGGQILFSGGPGPADQTKIEQRNDVLVYTSEVLTDALEVTGPVKLYLYAGSSAKDTDFTGKLVDVFPDGRAINLTHGILRARYRESMTEEKLMEPGTAYLFQIDLGQTANVFLPGHRIRLEVASANFPEFDRNPNSGKPFGTDTEGIKAEQTVFHDIQRPSHLLLPVIPRPSCAIAPTDPNQEGGD